MFRQFTFSSDIAAVRPLTNNGINSGLMPGTGIANFSCMTYRI